MNFSETMDKVLEQAREMQRQINDAVSQAQEQMKPRIEDSIKQAQALQATLQKHATETTEMASHQTQTMLGYLSDYMKMGNEALRESAEKTRETAQRMMEESRKVVETASSMIKKPE